jgi:hypothetical protein
VPGLDSTFTVPLSGAGLFPLTLSTTQLNFGDVLDNYPSFPPPSLPVTITNHGGLPLSLTSTNSNPLFTPGYGACSPLAGGASCTFPIFFTPLVAGPQTGVATITGTNSHNSAQAFTLPAIALSGYGHSILVQPSASFPLTLLGTPPASAFVGISNFSSAPATISRITVSGSAFTADVSACIGTLAGGRGSPGSFCYVRVTFTPTIAAALTGALTVYDDALSPQVIALSGVATAMKFVGPDPASQPAALFNPQPLLTTSIPQNFTLTNTGSVPLNLQGITAGGDYARSTNCKSPLAANASCTIAVSFEPAADGFRADSLTITAADPASPEQAPLSGLGIGIGQAKITIHYDYMVASDHTHDPEATAPGAIARIVQTFALHGIELIIDPHHTAIPEVPVITFYPGIPGELCAPDQVNFYALRSQYFSPKSPKQHYTLFAHSFTNHNYSCFATDSTGIAELPGLNFVVTMGDLQSRIPADLFASWTGNTFMHELGHNLGLAHGGGFGGGGNYPVCASGYCYFTDSVNYKPNYLSVMNYLFQPTGVPQADAVGSTNLKSCVVDPECGLGQSCLTYHSSATVTKRACYRQDYSTQQLPTGGSTPGMDETNLDETAGLGSGTVDISNFLARTPVGLVDTPIPTTGPVDWDYDGAADERHLAWPINIFWNLTSGDFSPLRMKGSDDWRGLLGTAPFGTSSVQTSSTIAPGSLGAAPAVQEPELDFKTAVAHHILFPLRPAPVVIQPGCNAQSKAVPAGAPGTFLVALLATDDFDPTQVDVTSLNFHGAKPVSVTLRDVNGDGMLDLVIEIPGNDVRLSRNATRARLTGWLKNSQAFVGEERVTVVADAFRAAAVCQ